MHKPERGNYFVVMINTITKFLSCSRTKESHHWAMYSFKTSVFPGTSRIQWRTIQNHEPLERNKKEAFIYLSSLFSEYTEQNESLQKLIMPRRDERAVLKTLGLLCTYRKVQLPLIPRPPKECCTASRNSAALCHCKNQSAPSYRFHPESASLEHLHCLNSERSFLSAALRRGCQRHTYPREEIARLFGLRWTKPLYQFTAKSNTNLIYSD